MGTRATIQREGKCLYKLSRIEARHGLSEYTFYRDCKGSIIHELCAQDDSYLFCKKCGKLIEWVEGKK